MRAEPLRTLGQEARAGGTCPARREAPTLQPDRPLSVHTTPARPGPDGGEGGDQGGDGPGKPAKRGGRWAAAECARQPQPRRIQLTPKQIEDGPIICGLCCAPFEAPFEPLEDGQDAGEDRYPSGVPRRAASGLACTR